jgi:hypothetical protein
MSKEKTEFRLANWDDVMKFIAEHLKDNKDIEIRKSKDGYKVFEVTKHKICEVVE